MLREIQLDYLLQSLCYSGYDLDSVFTEDEADSARHCNKLSEERVLGYDGIPIALHESVRNSKHHTCKKDVAVKPQLIFQPDDQLIECALTIA